MGFMVNNGEWYHKTRGMGLRASMLEINSGTLRNIYQIKSPNVPNGKGHTIKWVPPPQ